MTISSESLVKPKIPVRFVKRSGTDFFTLVKKRVHQHFIENNISMNANGKMLVKTALMIALFLLFYGLIISNHFQGWSLILLYSLIGITEAMMGFNIAHDALHGAYSSKSNINKFLGYSFDFNGTSSYVWKLSHNGKHHTYTNIPGHDEDIDKAILLRLSPTDKLYPFHYYQNWYGPILYFLTGIVWIWYGDYNWLLRAIKNNEISVKDTAIFLAFKIINATVYLLFPLFYLSAPWWQIVAGYLSMVFFGGFFLAVIFQLAHIVEKVQFPSPNDSGHLPNEWGVHEMLTTSNFANENRFISYFVGGLNFQIEHHLFPYICHIHYPVIRDIVKKTAKEFNIPYNEYTTFTQALKSHLNTLKRFGREPHFRTTLHDE